MFDRNDVPAAIRRMAATTFPPITKARRSRPLDSATNFWIWMFAPRSHRASSTDSTVSRLSANMTPAPCVPWFILRITGVPPTSRIAWKTASGDRASTVLGVGIRFFCMIWSDRNLSREFKIDSCELITVTPMLSKCWATASPYSVTVVPMRVRTTSRSDMSRSP